MTAIAARTGRTTAAVAHTLACWRHARRKVLRRHASEAAVHAWRIGCRRLVAVEQVLAPAVTGPGRGAMRALLHDAFHAAGRLRDMQLAIGRLRQLALRFPAATRLARRLQRGLARQRARVTRKVRAVRPRQVRAILATWDAPCMDPRRRAQRATQRLARARLRLQRAQAQRRSAQSLHRYRIELKLLRYMQEFSREAGLLHSAQPAPRLAGRQRRLGRITDLQVLLRMIADFGARHPAWRRQAAPLRRHLLRQRQQLLQALAPTRRE